MDATTLLIMTPYTGVRGCQPCVQALVGGDLRRSPGLYT